MAPTLILINPWIYDFAAYDLWSKPVGLLYIAAYLRHYGLGVHLIDCLDVHHPGMKCKPPMKIPKRRLYGTGKFWRQKVPTPSPLRHISRPYSRYGITREVFEQELRKTPEPAAILVTSLMTYWYPGVREAIRLAKKIHPGTPVILGGIYARLCHDHAIQNSGADWIVTHDTMPSILKLLNELGIEVPGHGMDPEDPVYPAFDLLGHIDYVCLMTSSGCPYRCQYCASHFLNPEFNQRDPLEVLGEILFWHNNYGIRDIAFYDDALLVASGSHLSVLLEKISDLDVNLRFHTPNAIHANEVTADVAELMHSTGFRTIRLGLETSDFSVHRDLDNKISEGDFERAVNHLLKAGFDSRDLGAYILTGLPGQSAASVNHTIDFVAGAGATPYLSEYSPIPHTALWEKAVSHSEYDLSSEPLYHNNTLLPCWDEDKRKELPRLKKQVLEIRERYR